VASLLWLLPLLPHCCWAASCWLLQAVAAVLLLLLLLLLVVVVVAAPGLRLLVAVLQLLVVVVALLLQLAHCLMQLMHSQQLQRPLWQHISTHRRGLSAVVHACMRAYVRNPATRHTAPNSNTSTINSRSSSTSSLLPAGTLSRRKGVARSRRFLLRVRAQRSGCSGGLNLAAAAASASPSVCIGGTLTAAFCSGGPK
jgi:hypothetical protein